MEKERKNSIIKEMIAAAVVVAVMVLLVFKNTESSEKAPGLLETLDGYRGYTRVISREEYEFYQYFVERELSEDINAEKLDELVKAYAGKVNAAFYLGNQLELCEPYSFSVLKLRMEQENASRQVKLQQGETVYGLKQFTLQTYFQYLMDNLQTSLWEYLEENADEEIMEMAEAYYEENKEDFRGRTEVVYEVTMNGETEIVTADSMMMNTLGKSDAGLADFLAAAEPGDTYEDEMERTIVLKDITYSEEGFENNRDLILYRYIREELYESVIERVAENNPVEFE